jgi:hypothetical protein
MAQWLDRHGNSKVAPASKPAVVQELSATPVKLAVVIKPVAEKKLVAPAPKPAIMQMEFDI